MVEVAVNWKDGLTFEGISSKGNKVIMDVPDSSGAMKGIGPMEMLLISVGGCTGMDVVSILEKEKVKVDGLTVKVSGERAAEHPKVYKKISIEYIVKGKEIPFDKVERAVNLSETKYCSASIMLAKSAVVERKIIIVE